MGFGAGDEMPFGCVVAIGEEFVAQRDTVTGSDGFIGFVPGAGEDHEFEVGIDLRNGSRDGLKDFFIPHHVVVEGSVRFDVAKFQAVGMGDGLEAFDLLSKCLGKRFGAHRDRCSPEVSRIGVARMGTDLDAVLFGQADIVFHGLYGTGMPPTGDVGLINEGVESGVIAGTFPEVAVETESILLLHHSAIIPISRSYVVADT